MSRSLFPSCRGPNDANHLGPPQATVFCPSHFPFSDVAGGFASFSLSLRFLSSPVNKGVLLRPPVWARFSAVVHNV